MKGAVVDTASGELVSERIRIPTPKPSTPESVAEAAVELISHFNYDGLIGVSFPTVIINDTSVTFGNLDKAWTGVPIGELFHKHTGRDFVIYNDADLAGYAEMQIGAGQNESGMVIMVTIGTGLGTGVFYNGQLIPNIELGRILGMDGRPIEFWAGDKARKDENLEWDEWAQRFDFFLKHIIRVFSPDLFILGGGASKKWDLYKDHISVNTPIKIARFKNNAGIIGAAIAAESMINGKRLF